MKAIYFLKKTGRTGLYWYFTKTKTVASIMEEYFQHRLKMADCAEYDDGIFPIGSELTSEESGKLIIAPPGTPKELIVGTVK